MPRFADQSPKSVSTAPPGTFRNGKTASDKRGYCYLALFEAFNESSARKLDVSAIKARLGAFPLVRRVVAELFAHVTFDLFMPCVRRVSNNMFHVDIWLPPMLFSEVVSMTQFSNARIGADDRAFLQQQQLTRVQDLCKTAGLDRNVVLADAAKKCLSRALAAPDSEMGAIFETMLPRGKTGFTSPYHLDVQQLANLQADYPELGVTGGGTYHHPHAYAAVATLCQEAVILKRMNYATDAKLARGYDAFVVDVGANYPRHAKAGRFNVHGCCPILNARDSGRDTTRALVISSLVASGKLTAETARKYTEPTAVVGKKLLRCDQKSEICTIRAQYMMFVHSQYDITLDQLGEMFDAHGTIKAYSVMNFVPDIFVASQGTVASLGLTYHKEGDDVIFSFVGDASMNYRHNLKNLVRTYTVQHLVTPSGVLFVCERVVRGGALFLEYTRCTVAPETQAELFDFNFWDSAAEETVYLTSWQYDHTRYVGSKFTKGPVGFRRIIVAVDRAFYERLYMHCLRSGDSSFIINHVVSAGTTFNTKMSINGANIRAVNRTSPDTFFDAVIAIYMIAYRTRWMGTKTLHHMIESEKSIRNDHKLGFTGLCSAMWKLTLSRCAGKILDTLTELWNAMVKKCSELNSAGDMDVALMHSVRRVHYSEFLQYNARYEGEYPELQDIHVEQITFNVKDGLLQEIGNVMRDKYSDEPSVPLKHAADPDGSYGLSHTPKKSDTSTTTASDFTPDPAKIIGAPTAAMSNKTRNTVLTEFHRTQSIKTESNSRRLRNGRHENYACTSVLVQKTTPPDGNCVFTSLGYFAGLTANEMRADICGATGNTDLRYNDRGSATWGNTDCIATFSTLHQKRVCVHMTVVRGKKTYPTVTTEMYSAYESTDIIHLDWRVVGDLKGNYTGHVEVLTALNDAQTFPREVDNWDTVSRKFDAVRAMRHTDTDEYHGFAMHQELKFLSLMDTAGFTSSRPLAVLELGAAPGTWTKLILAYTAAHKVRASFVTDPSGLAMDAEVVAEIDQDDLSSYHRQDALQYLASDIDKYDFVISDVATAESWADNAPQLDIICAVVSRLRTGATFVVKLSNVFLGNAVDAIASCRSLFSHVSAVKPAGSRMRNTEFYLVCKGFGQPARKNFPYAERRDIASAILRHLEKLVAREDVRLDVVDEYTRLSMDYISHTDDCSAEWDEMVAQDAPGDDALNMPPPLPISKLYAITPGLDFSTLTDDDTCDTSAPERMATPPADLAASSEESDTSIDAPSAASTDATEPKLTPPTPTPIPSCTFTPSSLTTQHIPPSAASDRSDVKSVVDGKPPRPSSVFLQENGLVMALDDALFDQEHPWQSVAHHMRVNHPGKGLYERVMELGVYTNRVHYEYDELVSALGACTCDFPLPESLDGFLRSDSMVKITRHHDLEQLVDGVTLVVRVSDPGVEKLHLAGWNVQVHRCRTTPPSDVSVYYVYTQKAARVLSGSWKQNLTQVLNAAEKETAPYDPSLLRAVLHNTKAGGVLDELDATTVCDLHEQLDESCLCCAYLAEGAVQPPMVSSWLKRKYHAAVAKVKSKVMTYGGAESASLDVAVPFYLRRELAAAKKSGMAVNGSTVEIIDYKPDPVLKALPFTVGGQVVAAMKPGTHKIDVGGDHVAHVTTYGSVATRTVDYWGANGRTSAAVTDKNGNRTLMHQLTGTICDVKPIVTYVKRPEPNARTVRDVSIGASDGKFGCVSVMASQPRRANVEFVRKAITLKVQSTQTDAEYHAYQPCMKKLDETEVSSVLSTSRSYATSTTSTPTDMSHMPESGPVAFTAAWKAKAEAAMAQKKKRKDEDASSTLSSVGTFRPQATSSTKSASTGARSAKDKLGLNLTGTTFSNASSSAVSETSTPTRDSASTKSTPSVSTDAVGHVSTDVLLPAQPKRTKLQACKSMLKAAIFTTKPAQQVLKRAAEVCEVLPRTASTDTLAVGGIWTSYPHDCRVVLCLVSECDKTYLATDGLAKRLKTERPTDSDLTKRGYSKLEHTLNIYYACETTHDFVLVVPTVGAEAVLRRFLTWLPEDVSRVAVESAVDLNDTAFVEILRECARPVALVDGRTRKWAGVLHLLEPAKRLLPTRPRALAFPKLSQVEMGYIPNPPWIAAKTNQDRYRNAMIEFRYATAHADAYNKLHFQKMQLDSKNGITAGQTTDILAAGYGVYDQHAKSYLGQKVSRTYSHGYSVSSQEYVAWNETARQFNTSDRYVLVGRNTELMLNTQISAQIANVSVESQFLPEVQWINGPPGCGKTHEIVHTANVSPDPKVGRDLILSMTKEGKISIQAGLKRRFPSLTDSALKTHVRTVASVLVNGSDVKYDRVLMDEALMAHAGTIGFVVALTGTKKVLIIGDIHQIPYVDREHMCELRYETPAVFADVTSVKEITYRCPMDVTYAISKLYPNLCTMSLVTLSVTQKPWSSNAAIIPKGVDQCLYLTHNQPDKDVLVKAGYGVGSGSTVLTIHEAQGLTFPHVICIRSQPRALAIFSRSEYALVAISRHTQSFVYYTDVPDALSAFIKRAQSMDPAALQSWNAPRLRAAQKKLTPISAGGLLCEGETLMVPLTGATTGEYALGLPEVSHAPMMPTVPDRVAESTFRKLPKFRPNVDTDVAFLQTFYDDMMAEAITVEYKYDQMMMEMEDTYMVSTPVTIDPLSGLVVERKFGKLRPLLRTNMRAEKQPSQKESLLGAIKRNLNAPVLRNPTMSEEAIGDSLFLNFERSAIDETKMALYESYRDDPIGISSQVVSIWLEKQPPSRRKQIISELPLHLRPFNNFEFMVKKDVKPQLTPDSTYSYPSVQTIVYNDASVNAVSCPIYNLLWERLLAVLDPRVLIMTGMSPQEFENEFNARLSPELAAVLQTLENDFSKYDKAQAGALRRLEHLVWTKLGLDPEIALIWDRSRRKSNVRDRKNGVSFTTEFQRKSGEATTFSGNTLVAVCVMLAVVDIDDIVLMLAAGDDTLIYLKPGTQVHDSSLLVADLFNLECKLLECYEIPYFCSKFLITTPDWTYLVHDLLKFVTKLGRHDMSNYEHVENYRISCVDTMLSLFNPVVAPGLTLGLQERYNCTLADVTKVLAVLRTICHDPNKFAALYLHDKGVILCNDVSASKLR